MTISMLEYEVGEETGKQRDAGNGEPESRSCRDGPREPGEHGTSNKTKNVLEKAVSRIICSRRWKTSFLKMG